MNNYYRDLWTQKNSHGDLFWKQVDFNTNAYKYQEKIFRNTLVSLKRMYDAFEPEPKKIETVLELGAGTGRMTKIMLEVFPDIKKYEVVDLSVDVEKIYKTLGFDTVNRIDWNYMDITTDEFLEGFRGKRYDFILASEVFLHIKPEDIEKVMQMVCRLAKSKGSGTILNIDWAFDPNGAPSEWCFIHDYDKLYRENGLELIYTADMKEIKQKLFVYGAQ